MITGRRRAPKGPGARPLSAPKAREVSSGGLLEHSQLEQRRYCQKVIEDIGHAILAYHDAERCQMYCSEPIHPDRVCLAWDWICCQRCFREIDE